MLRRAFLCAVAAPLSFALWSATDDLVSLLADLASSLSEGNAARCLSLFDRRMPGYAEIQAGVSALIDQAEVGCSIEILTRTDDAADVDWFLQIRSRAESGLLERRRERVKISFGKQGNALKIASLAPLTILAPPKLPDASL